jgi:hypothetical protein
VPLNRHLFLLIVGQQPVFSQQAGARRLPLVISCLASAL